MSKSKGNVIAPGEVIRKYGAEVLRLWVGALDYRNDNPLSQEILERVAESYRKIRNTVRYLLANLSDFTPGRDEVPLPEMEEMDRYALLLFDRLAGKVRQAYEEYEFHVLYHAVNNFCSVDMSAFYLNVLKDRMYCSRPDDRERRSAQTAMFHIASGLLPLIAPVLSFTADEAWGYLPGWPGKPESVFLADIPAPRGVPDAEALAARWERILALRAEIAKPLETARKEKVIGSDQDALVTVSPGPFADLLGTHARELRDVLIVSGLAVGEAPGPDAFGSEAFPGLRVRVEKAPWGKCERCWNHTPEVGTIPAAPELCGRCASAVGK